MYQIPIECQLDTLIPTTDFKGKEIYSHASMFFLEQCTRTGIHLYTRRFNLASVYLIYVNTHTHTRSQKTYTSYFHLKMLVTQNIKR